jgi:hypothetical protein
MRIRADASPSSVAPPAVIFSGFIAPVASCTSELLWSRSVTSGSVACPVVVYVNTPLDSWSR